MSIEVSNTVDFFYLGGVVQGLAKESHAIAASVSIGLVGVVAAINLRDRLIQHRNFKELVFAISSLATETLQVMSGILTGMGVKYLYQASLLSQLELGSLSIVAILGGACLSFASLAIHRWMQRSLHPTMS